MSDQNATVKYDDDECKCQVNVCNKQHCNEVNNK